MLVRQIISNLQLLFSSLSSSPLPEGPPSSSTIRSPSSVASSPHLSLSIPPPPPHPLSDSSASLFSLHSSIPSLWLQLTLGKLLVGVSSVPQSAQDAVVYVMEGDEVSFSFDLQEKRNSFQFKLSSLEASANHINHTSFTKLFSSQSTVVTTMVAKEIERQFGSLLGSTRHLPVSVLSPLSPLTSFLLLEVITFKDENRSAEIKLQAQTFEVVVWLPLVTSILEILGEVTSNENTKMRKVSEYIIPVE